jgi:acetyl esterase
MSDGAVKLLADLAVSLPPVEGQTLEAVRARAPLASRLLALSPAPPTTDYTVDRLASAVRVRIYKRANSGGILLYFHGGGFVLGGLDASDHTCNRLADDLGWTVLSVDYPLAPEHPFPAAVEVGYEALCWAREHCEALVGVDRIGVAGDSAGGGLAAAVALLARDRSGPSLDLQVLLYPVIRCRTDAAEYAPGRDTVLLSATGMAWYCRQYLPRPELANHPLASPLLADDLAGLPPTVIATVGHDPLTPDIAAFATRLSVAGVSLTHLHHASGFHGFYSFADVIVAAGEAWRDVASQFRLFTGG